MAESFGGIADFNNHMKFQLIIDLDIPEEELNLGEGESFSEVHQAGVQSVFNNFTNYAVSHHLNEALEWLGKEEETRYKSFARKACERHRAWAAAIENAQAHMVILKQ